MQKKIGKKNLEQMFSGCFYSSARTVRRFVANNNCVDANHNTTNLIFSFMSREIEVSNKYM